MHLSWGWLGPVSSVATVVALVVTLFYYLYCWPFHLKRPESLTAKSDHDRVMLSWQPVRRASNYNIYRTSEGGMIDVFSSTTHHHNDTAVAGGATYEYHVVAEDQGHQSPPSAPVSVVVKGDPAVQTSPTPPMPGPPPEAPPDGGRAGGSETGNGAAPPPEDSPEAQWPLEDLRRLVPLLRNNKTVLSLLEMTAARPGTLVSFPDVCERAGVTRRQGGAAIGGLTVLIKRLNKTRWPLTYHHGKGGESVPYYMVSEEMAWRLRQAGVEPEQGASGPRDMTSLTGKTGGGLTGKTNGALTEGDGADRFGRALAALDRWAARTGRKAPAPDQERTFAETQLRAWLDGDGTPLDWTHPLGSAGYPGVTADEWFFITTLYGTMTLAGQRTHIRRFYPSLFVEAAGRDTRNFHAGMAGFAGLRQNWMKTRLIRMGQILSTSGRTMTQYVEELRGLEQGATPDRPTPALDRIFADHQTGSGKTLSVFVRDCVLGNCFPIDSRVRAQLRVFGLPSNEEDEGWLVGRCLAAARNPRQVARLFYDAGGAVSGDARPPVSHRSTADVEESPELDDEDERILDRTWENIADEKKARGSGAEGNHGAVTDAASDRSADGVVVFADDDEAYTQWLTAHPSGYVVNCRRSMSPDYMALHTAGCGLVSRYVGDASPGAFTERGLIKVCADNLAGLRAWVSRHGRPDGSFTGNCRCGRRG